jgi:transposase
MRCLEIVSILEILRLWEQGLSQREIGASVNCGKSTVGDIQQRCKVAGLTYAEASGLTNAAIKARLYPSKNTSATTDGPDWDKVHAWIKSGKRRNLRMAWEDYRFANRDGLSYSQFCRRYGEWTDATGKKVTMVQHHEPGKEVYLDWMGDTLDCVSDPDTGRLQTAHFFASSLGYSCYPYIEAFPDEGMGSWIAGNIHSMEWYGGVPRIAVPDNCKVAVTKPNYYDPKINPTFHEFAKHYGIAVIPARIRKPRDKSVVEGNIGWLEAWLLEWLRGQRFLSFTELNRAIRQRVKELAGRPFEERQGSRRSEYEEFDRPALRPLPPTRFEHVDYITRTVPDNYHVEYGKFYYSVHYTLYKQEVTVRATTTLIEIINGNREVIALHERRYAGRRYVTKEEHMPENHRRQLEFSRRTGRDYVNWAATIGVNTRTVIERMLNAQEFEETAYRSCMGVLQFAKKYSPKELEAACERALQLNSPFYTTVKTQLQSPPKKKRQQPLPSHENLRNPAEFM